MPALYQRVHLLRAVKESRAPASSVACVIKKKCLFYVCPSAGGVYMIIEYAEERVIKVQKKSIFCMCARTRMLHVHMKPIWFLGCGLCMSARAIDANLPSARKKLHSMHTHSERQSVCEPA